LNSRSIIRICLPIVFSLVVIFTLELIVRGIVHLFDIQLDIVVIHPNLGQAELKKQIYLNDRYLLWKMKPNLDARFVSPALTPPGHRPPVFRVITNSRGFAGEDFPDVKEDGTLRIVCLGNSSTFGWGVQPDSCYARILEKIVRTGIGKDVEVINAGIPGYSSLQGLALFEREIAGLCPDVITISFGANDCHLTSRGDAEIMKEREGSIGALQEFMSHFAIYRTLRYFIISSRIKNDITLTGSLTRHRVNPATFLNAMRNLVSSGRKTGAAVILVGIFPNSDRWDPYRKGLVNVSLDCGVPLLDTGELFEEFLLNDEGIDETELSHMRATLNMYGEGILERHPDICLRLDMVHPTPLGHILIARSISGLILTELRPEDD